MSIMEAANRTASWANTQPWEIFVAAGEPLEQLREAFAEEFARDATRNPDLPIPRDWPAEMEQRMVELRAARFNALGADQHDASVRKELVEQNRRFFGAPAVVYLCMDRSLTSWSIFDIGMMAQSIMLAATHHGIGSIPAFNLVAFPDLVRAGLGIPDKLQIIIGIALGYEEDSSPHNRYRSSRRPVEDTVSLQGF
jgi:nitroreductase